MLTLTVETDGAVHKIETVAQRFDDLAVPLKVWNGYFRKRVQQRFDEGGPGWPPTQKSVRQIGGSKVNLGDSNVDEAIKRLADELLRKKLKKQLKRAQKRMSFAKGTAAAVQRRYEVLKTFEFLSAGGSSTVSLTGDARLDKSISGLRERHARATAAAAKRPLGKVASSIKSKLTNAEVVVWSEIPWAGVHNRGGTAGHGAKEPKRTFLEIDADDIRVLVTLIQIHLTSEH